MDKPEISFYATVDDIIERGVKCPIDLSVIPNYMGINLCCVHAVAWQRLQDGQLTSMTFYFIPEETK